MRAIKFYTIYGIVCIITIACFLMNGPMRGGLPIDSSLPERVLFIKENGLIWSISWFSWMLSALGLFVFCAIFSDELKPNVWRTIGLGIVGMGIAPDLTAEVIYAFVIPEIIDRGYNLDLIGTLEVITMHLTGYLGNGLYNIGGLLLTVLAVRQGILKPWIAIWGISAWVLGLLLSFSVAIDAIKMAEITTAMAMILSTSWMVIFAHKVLRK